MILTTHFIWLGMVWWSVNSELERMWTETVCCLIGYSILTFKWVELEKDTRKNSCRSNQVLWRDFHWDLMNKSNWLRHVTRMNKRMPKKCWIIDQMDVDVLEVFWRDYKTRPNQVYQGLIRDDWWWWWFVYFYCKSLCILIVRPRILFYVYLLLSMYS